LKILSKKEEGRRKKEEGRRKKVIQINIFRRLEIAATQTKSACAD